MCRDYYKLNHELSHKSSRDQNESWVNSPVDNYGICIVPQCNALHSSTIP